MTYQFKTTIYATDQDGGDVEVDVRIHYDAHYQAAFTTGLPENCYPEDGELTITEVETLHDLPLGITEDMVTLAAEADSERLIQEAWEDFFGADE